MQPSLCHANRHSEGGRSLCTTRPRRDRHRRPRRLGAFPCLVALRLRKAWRGGEGGHEAALDGRGEVLQRAKARAEANEKARHLQRINLRKNATERYFGEALEQEYPLAEPIEFFLNVGPKPASRPPLPDRWKNFHKLLPK